jgi:predicted DNA binding CopG/RHH family protein
MRQPRLGDLRLDRAGTRKMRVAAKRDSIKITINIDRDSLSLLRAMAEETGVPYQRLLNALLKEGLKGRETIQARVEHLEQELKKVKRRLAA